MIFVKYQKHGTSLVCNCFVPEHANRITPVLRKTVPENLQQKPTDSGTKLQSAQKPQNNAIRTLFKFFLQFVLMKQFLLPVPATLILLVLVSGVQAIELKYYGIEDIIKEDFTVENKITLRFSQPIAHLDYHLDFKVQNLTVSSAFLSDCKVMDRNGGSTISCDFTGMTAEKSQLVLNFMTKDIIREVGGDYQFSVNYGVSLPIERTFTLIRLPENNVLSGDINMSIFPQDGKTITDGRHIMVYWERENLTSGSNLQFSVLYSKPAGVSDTMLLGLAFVFILILIAIVFLLRRQKPTERPATSILNRDEKVIVDILERNEGKVLQKVLVRETDFSKAKVSRLVKNLRERGVVDIEPVSGRENRVILKLGKE